MGITVKATADVDPQVWEDVKAVLKCHDFTVSDAFRLMLMHTAMSKELPFDCIIPGPKTVAAMEEFERGEGVTFCHVDDLIAELNREDDEDGCLR